MYYDNNSKMFLRGRVYDDNNNIIITALLFMAGAGESETDDKFATKYIIRLYKRARAQKLSTPPICAIYR